MRNTGILLFLVGIYVVVNSGSFRDLVMGKAKVGFLTPGTGRVDTHPEEDIKHTTEWDIAHHASPH